MKKLVITIGLLLALAAAGFAETKKALAPVEPDPDEFAYRLVAVFGGEDHFLDKEETITVLRFLKKHLPEQTTGTGLSVRLKRENIVGNAGQGAMTEERHALREYEPEQYVATFVKKFDRNKDKVLSWTELADAMSKVMGVPPTSRDWKKRSTADTEE
ncbi:MAG: hypothetical protein AB3N63_13090 [Puniceicoccaceae bacterium]